MNILCWIGSTLALSALCWIFLEHQSIRQCEITQGIVIELVSSRGSKGSTVYSPRITFTPPDGSPITFKTSVASSSPGVKIGDSVYVAYPSRSPNQAKLLRFGHRFGAPYVILGVGLLMIYLGCGFANGNAWIEKIYLSSSSQLRP